MDDAWEANMPVFLRTLSVSLRSSAMVCAIAALFVCGTQGLALAKNSTKADVKGIVVRVELVDSSVDPTLTGATTMATRLDKATVKAGPVTFVVHNASKSAMHEMVLIAAKDPKMTMPMDDKEDKVVEDKVKHLGEVADLEPGTSGSLKRKLAPGSYILICNQPGHYHAGMWATLTVTP
jgi:uncharacterized cupredoxin-like copper-binding protein